MATWTTRFFNKSSTGWGAEFPARRSTKYLSARSLSPSGSIPCFAEAVQSAWVSADVNLGENCDDASLILYSRRPVLGVPLTNKTFHSSEPMHRLFSFLSIPAYSRGPAEGTSSARASPLPTGRIGLLLARCSWPSTVTTTRRGSCSFKLRSPPRTAWELLKDKHFFSPSCNRRPRSTRIFRMFVMYRWTSAFNRRSPSR